MVKPNITFHPSPMKRTILVALLHLPLTALAQPALDWASTMGGLGSETGSGITRDALGNTYIIGSYSDTADFDPGPGVYNLVPVDIYGDFFVQKLDVNGDFVWAKGIGSIGGDNGYGIAVDAAGNVYVAGHYRNAADFDPDPVDVFLMTPVGVQDGFVLKLDTDGEFLWAATFGNTAVDGCRGIVLNSTGNILICGFNTGTADMDPDPVDVFDLTAVGAYSEAYICELTALGDFVNAWLVGGTYYQNPFDITVDASDNIYMVGRYSGTADFDPGPSTQNRSSVGLTDDIFLLKLNAAGAYQWVNTIGSSDDEMSTSVSVDGNGSVHITGEFRGAADFDPGAGVQSMTPFGGKDVFIATYTSAGQYVWAGQFGGTGDETASSVFALPDGEVLCTGLFSGTADLDPGAGVFGLTTNGAFADGFLLQLDNSGSLDWAFAISGPGTDAGSDVLQDASGAILCTGYFSDVVDLDIGPGVSSITSSGEFDAFVCTFDANLSVGTTLDPFVHPRISIQPNPFTDRTTIQFAEEQWNATITITDGLGRVVRTIAGVNGSSAIVEKGGLSAGLYVVRIDSGSQPTLSTRLLVR